MIKIVTALGNPNLNNELKKYREFEIISKDIQYTDGVIEVLELNADIDYLIISEILEGQISLENLVDIIYKINRKIKIVAILNEKNIQLEEKLLRKGIYDILYDKTDLIEIINLLKTRNIESLNKELREEIENLKSIIIKKKNKKIFTKNNENIEKKQKIKECKIIGITGSRGIGKTTFSIILANYIKNKYKILILDFDFINSDINNIYKEKDNIKKTNDFFIEDYITKVEDNISVITGLNSLYYSEKLNIENLKYELNKIKDNYDYIIIDTYSELTFSENKIVFEMCDKILFLTGINNLEIQKTKKLLNIMWKNWKINNKKIYMVLYKYKIIDLIFFNEINLKNIFKNIKIIGKMKYQHISNIYINKSFKNMLINILIKKDCLSLINKINRSDFNE
ncbi:MAG: AAA family ATPase [Clostridia bacterium]|nr:AAA family ATPase [Clostridia bacterium]